VATTQATTTTVYQPPTTVDTRKVYLRGVPYQDGYAYGVRLAGFPPGKTVNVYCHADVLPGGLGPFKLTVNDFGETLEVLLCWAPLGTTGTHWVTADGVMSALVNW